MSGNWNEYNLNPLTRIHWRASLVDIQPMLLTPEIVGQLLFFAIVMPASRAIIQLNGLIAGKTTWYGEGLHNYGLIPWRAFKG